MKKTKLLSFLLTASLLFQTAEIPTLAAALPDPAPIEESAEAMTKADDAELPAEEGSSDSDKETAKEASNAGQPSAEETENREATADTDMDADTPQPPSAEETDNRETAVDADIDAGTPQLPSAEETDHPEANADADMDADTPQLPSTEETQAPDVGSDANTDADDSQPPSTENTEEGESPDQTAADDTISENTLPENTLPENTLPENTLSENTLSEDERPDENADTNIFSVFPGLGDDYTFSSRQLADKKVLSSHMEDIVRINSAKTAAAEDYADAEGEYEPGEVVYLAKTRAEAEQVAEAFGGTLDSYSYEVAVIGLPPKATVPLAVAAASEPDIKLPAVWPNYYNELSTNDTAASAPFSPSDPDYARQWQHDYIGTRYAWAAGFKGQGVKVAIIDTGLQQNHEDLSANAADGKNFVRGENGTPNYVDNQSHGTHVAGIIAADDNGIGGVGIAPDASIRGYCVFPSAGGALDTDIMRAINAAVEDGNDIINLSLGTAYYSAPYEETMQNAYEQGVAVFAAAGNDDSDGRNFPAAYKSTISVGAIDQNGTRASFSNYNQDVNLAFPGVSIYSTIPTGYDYISGTSQASPAAAGTAAVILSADETIRNKTGKARVNALLSAMKSSAIQCPDSGMGAGTTYLPDALKLATETAAPETPVITVVDEGGYQRGKNQKDYIAQSIDVVLSSNTAAGVAIYYATDGKTPAYKNGTVLNAENQEPYVPGTKITLTGAKKKTIKAIALNPTSGKASKAASRSFTLTPIPSGVTVVPQNNVSRIAVGKSLKFTAVVAPSYAISQKVTWSVDDKARAAGITVSNGTVKTKKSTPPGEYRVTAVAIGSDRTSFNGEADTCTFTVIDAARVKKIAFLDKASRRPLKSGNLDTVTSGNSTFALKDYLTVTMAGQTGSAGTELTGEAALAEVVWSSSNSKVAAVSSDGVITAKAPGKAVIKAVSNDGGQKSASYKVTVTQPVTGITLSGPTKVAAGKKITLTADVKPSNARNKKLDWKVSGNDKVSISASGKVTAKKDASGTCTVTATAKDGSGISDTCEVTVVSGEITKITLGTKKVTLFPTNTSADVSATKAALTPSVECRGKDTALLQTLISWTSSAPSIAEVDENGTVTAKAPGKAVITCASTDGSNKKSTCTINVSIPMSKLVIGPTNGNDGIIAVGQMVKMAAVYYSQYGTPANKMINWTIANCSPSLQDKVFVNPDGTVFVAGDVQAASNSDDFFTVQATAQDGSGVASNLYRFTVRPHYLTARIVLSERGFIVEATTEEVSPGDSSWSSAHWEWIADYCTATISGPENCGLSKSRGRMEPGGPIYCAYKPVPVKYTDKNLDSNETELYPDEVDRLTLTVKLKDGSNLTAQRTIFAVNYINRLGNPDIGYFD